MSALTESELAREARKILRKLLAGAHLERGEDGSYGVVARARTARYAKTKVDAALAAAMRARGWLAAEEGGARLVLTAAGEGWYARSLAGSDPFAAQHQLRRTRTVCDEHGREHRVVVNAAESPLLWMCQHKLIGEVQCQAGERLRRDYTLAQLSPRLGVDLSAPVVFGRRAQKNRALVRHGACRQTALCRGHARGGPGPRRYSVRRLLPSERIGTERTVARLAQGFGQGGAADRARSPGAALRHALRAAPGAGESLGQGGRLCLTQKKPPPRVSRGVRAARTVECLEVHDTRDEVSADAPPMIGPRLCAHLKLGLDPVEIAQNRFAKIACHIQSGGACFLTVPAKSCRRRQGRQFAHLDRGIASGARPAETQIGFVRYKHRDEGD